MKNFLKNKMFKGTLLGLSLALVMIGGVFISSTPAQAAITGGTITGVSGADLVANTANADYNFSFNSTSTDALQIILTFPVGVNKFTITNGNLTTAAISDGTTSGRIKVNGVSFAVDTVTGNSASGTITIVTPVAHNYNAGPVTFRLLSGITNPTLVGATDNLTFNTDGTGETAQANVTGPTITAGTASYLTVTGTASVAAGATNELSITAKDAYGNTATTYTGDKVLVFSGPGLAPNLATSTVEGVNVGASTTVAFSNGVSTVGSSTLIVYNAATTTVDVSDGSIDSTGNIAYDLDLTITPGAGAALFFTTSPNATTTSGIALAVQPVVTAKDAYGNIATGFGSVVTLTQASAGSLTNATTSAVTGVAAFSTLTYSNLADGETFALTATSGVLTTAVTGSIASDVVATKLVFSTEPNATSTSGVALAVQPIVTAKNAQDKVDTGFVGNVTLTDNAAGALSGTTATTSVAGVATFTDVAYTNSVVDHETFNLLANDGTLTQATSSAVNPNIVATTISITTLPGSIVSGVSMTQPVVKYVNGVIVDTDVTDTITISENGAGSLAGTMATSSVAGVATFTDLVYSALADNESVVFTFTDDIGAVNLSGSPATTSPIIADVLATKLVFSTQPNATSTSGVALVVQPAVQAQNAQNLLDTDFVGAVVITDNAAGALSGTATTTAVGGVATSTDLAYTNGVVDHESFNLLANYGALTQATSNAVNPNVIATKLAFTTQPNATSTSGSLLAVQPIVQAQDVNGILDLDFTGDVVITDNAAGALSGTATTTAVSGTATSTDLIYTNAAVDHESFNLLANSAGLTQATSSAVSPNIVATALSVTTAPGSIVSGVSMTQPVVKYVLGSIVDTDVNGTDIITISEDGAGSIAGVATTTTVSGVATFSGLVYSALADNEAVTFTFTDDGAGLSLTAATSSQVADVLATKLVFSTEPNATTTSGVALVVQPTVQAQNAQNLLDTDFVSAITIADNAAGTLTGSSTIVATAGAATSTDLVYTNGAVDHELFNLLANGGGLTQATSTEINPNVVATILSISTPPSNIISGVSMTQPVVKYVNAIGIVDIDVTDIVTASSTGAGTLTGDTTIAAVAGVATSTDLVYSATADSESVVFSFSDGGALALSPATTTSLNADVLATKLIWTVSPSNCVSGFACSVQGTVQAQNAQNLLDSNKAASVAITENEAGSLVGTSIQGMSAGILNTAGIGYSATVDGQTFTLTATSSGLTDATTAATSSDVVATKFLVVPTSYTPVAGVADTLTVTAADANGITDTGYSTSSKTYNFLDSGLSAIVLHTSPNNTAPTVPSSATTSAAFSSGVASLTTFTLTKAEVLGTITVTDGAISGTSTSVTVKHATSNSFTVTTSTTTPTTNTTLNAVVTAKDSYGNTADGANGATPFTGIVFLTTNATAPIWYNQVGNITASGTKTFSSAVKFPTVESGVIVTAENSGATVTGTSSAITVSAVADTTTAASVTKTSLEKKRATMDGNFDNGWRWVLDVTVPTASTSLQMTFGNFTGAGTISAHNNIRFYSAQSSDHSATSSAITITNTAGASATWSGTMAIDTSVDLEAATMGRQIQIVIQAAVPNGSVDGGYSASYDIR